MTGLTVTPPTKTVYAAGEELDTTGMKVEAKYSDNTTKELTEEEYMLSGFDSSKAGTITSGEDRFMEWKTKDYSADICRRAERDIRYCDQG